MSSFEALVEPHRATLRLHCYRMLGSSHDSDDMVQETFVRAFRAQHTLEDPTRVRAWLHRIATNVCIDELAKRPRRARGPELGPPADPDLAPVAATADAEWIEPAPSLSGSGHYAVWLYEGEPGCDDRTPIHLVSGKGQLFDLGLGARCLPVNNTESAGACPCPVAFPTGRTSKPLGAGRASLLCLNRKPGYPRAPVAFEQVFPTGDFVAGAVVQDLNSLNSPAKNLSVGNWLVIHAL